MDIQKVWEDTKVILKKELGSAFFLTWIEPIQIVSITSDKIVLLVENRFHTDWIKDNNYGKLVEAFAQVLHEERPIEFIEKNSRPIENVPSRLDSPNTTKTFSNFIVGKCNEVAHAGAIAAATYPGSKVHNPVYLWAGSGLGKTHLLHAIGNKITSDNPSAKVVYISAETFTTKLIAAIRRQKQQEFRDLYRKNLDVLLIDDIQFIANKQSTQEELFYTFETLTAEGKQIAMTSDLPFNELPGVEVRLKTRFGGGFSSDLLTPDYETMFAIINLKAEELSLPITNDAVTLMAESYKNVRLLEGALSQLKVIYSLNYEPVNAEMVKNYLHIDYPTKVTTPEHIIKIIAKGHGLKPSDITGKSHQKRIVAPRHICVYLMRERGFSFPDIGRSLGGRDSSTIQHAYKKILTLLKTDSEFKNTVQNLNRLVDQ